MTTTMIAPTRCPDCGRPMTPYLGMDMLECRCCGASIDVELDPAVREARRLVEDLDEDDGKMVLVYLAGYAPETVSQTLEELFGTKADPRLDCSARYM